MKLEVLEMKWLITFLITVLFSQAGFCLSRAHQLKIVQRARLEVTRNVKYDASYQQINYPGGDVPKEIGSCADVVVRAYRALNYDFQVLIHKERGNNSDKNIDHRRCRNQIDYLKKHALALTNNTNSSDWKPGDIVYWDLNNKGLLHTGIISDRKTRDGKPYIIHNIGPSASEEAVLENWKIIAHFRIQSKNVPINKTQ